MHPYVWSEDGSMVGPGNMVTCNIEFDLLGEVFEFLEAAVVTNSGLWSVRNLRDVNIHKPKTVWRTCVLSAQIRSHRHPETNQL